jgi:hypothetical protein
VEGFGSARICYVDDGKSFRASLPSAGGVARPSTVERSVRARHGPRVIGSGAGELRFYIYGNKKHVLMGLMFGSAREEDDTATVAARRELPNANAPAPVATEVEVPRRGLTTTVTRALVTIAGGMTGRNAAAAAQTQTPQAQARGANVSDLMNVRPVQAVLPARTLAAQAQAQVQAQVQAQGARPVVGARVVRPVSVPVFDVMSVVLSVCYHVDGCSCWDTHVWDDSSDYGRCKLDSRRTRRTHF